MHKTSVRMNSSKREHHLFLTSSDSSVYFPFNSSCDFQIELPEIFLLHGNWTVALSQISFKDEIAEDITVYCDLAGSSFIQDTRLPVLRVIPKSTEKIFTFDNPLRIDLSRDEIKRLRVFIRTDDMRTPSFIQKAVKCTLHLRRE